jgi:hypothetical protein
MLVWSQSLDMNTEGWQDEQPTYILEINPILILALFF